MHIVHRGHNRGPCFFKQGDYLHYLQRLEESAQRFGCAIHAFVLMTNHVHLLVTPDDPAGVSSFMKRVAQQHAQLMNRRHKRTGAFWQGRFYSCYVACEAYLLRCHRYIETNPVRAGMVRHPAAYAWSSFRANAWGDPSTLLSRHPVCAALGADPRDRHLAYRGLFEQPLDAAALDEIRKATFRGGILTKEGLSQDFAQRKVGTVPGARP